MFAICLLVCVKTTQTTKKQQKMLKKQPNITKKRIALESLTFDIKSYLTNHIFVNCQAVLSKTIDEFIIWF